MAGLSALLLAAGCSSRFGPSNKLLADLNGMPMVRRAAKTLIDAGCFDQVLVVTGHQRLAVERNLAGLPVQFVFNETWASGIGSSIACGVHRLSKETEGVAIALGDMPFLTDSLLRHLNAAFQRSGNNVIVFPALSQGRQRNPVIWPRRFFPHLRQLKPAEGGKTLLKSFQGDCMPVPYSDSHLLRDIDDEEALQIARTSMREVPEVRTGTALPSISAGKIRRPTNGQPTERPVT